MNCAAKLEALFKGYWANRVTVEGMSLAHNPSRGLNGAFLKGQSRYVDVRCESDESGVLVSWRDQTNPDYRSDMKKYPIQVLSVGDAARVAEAVFKMVEHFLGSYPLDSVITQIATQTTTTAAAASRASGSGGDSRRSLDEAEELGTRLQKSMSVAGQLHQQTIEVKREFSSFIVDYLDLLLEKAVRPSLGQMTRGFITVLPEDHDDGEFHYYAEAYNHIYHDLQFVAHGHKDTKFAVVFTVQRSVCILDSGEFAACVWVVTVPYFNVNQLYEDLYESCWDEMQEEGEDMRDTNVLERLSEEATERVWEEMGEQFALSPSDSVFITGSPRDDAARVAEVLASLTLDKSMRMLEDLGVQRVHAEDWFELI